MAEDSTIRELQKEVAALRRRVAEFESAEADWRRTERDLRHGHEELQAIYDATPDALVIVDVQTLQRVRTNARLSQMLGYSEGELPIDLRSLHPSEEIPSILEKFQAQAEGRLPLAENIPFIRKDGSILYADITGNPIKYQGRPCVLAFGRDVTDRRRIWQARGPGIPRRREVPEFPRSCRDRRRLPG